MTEEARKVRIVQYDTHRQGWYVQTADKHSDLWWTQNYCFTRWGARRVARRYLRAPIIEAIE